MPSHAQFDQSGVHRAARQYAMTARLMGVDFLPLERRNDTPFAGLADSSSKELLSKADALRALSQRHDATCQHCTTAKGHTQFVFGEGSCDADIMFIGEAPGEEEDRTGRPFVGRAGQKLDEIIRAMGLTREQVYIANILKARPPENRTPLPDEIGRCAPFLAEQIRIIQPRVIVALGNPATKFLLQTDIGITRLRGQWAMYDDGVVHIPVMPTYHPAYLLRNYTPETRKQMWSDMQKVMAKISEG